MLYQIRKRTKTEKIVNSLHLYFSDLLLNNASKDISKSIQKSHTVTIRNCWIQKYKPKKIILIGS